MKLNLFAAAAILAATVSAQASVITTSLESVTGATVIGFEQFDGLVNITGTIDLGQGVSFSGDLDAELSPFARDLGNNGLWTYALNGFAASGSSGAMTFNLGSLRSGVSAFVSHEGGASLLVEALGTGGQVLESTTLSVQASGGMFGYDEGLHIGFQRGQLDIAALRITGTGAVADNISAVPEPSGLVLALAGLGMVALLARKASHHAR